MKDWPKPPKVVRLVPKRQPGYRDQCILWCRYADGMAGWVTWRMDPPKPNQTAKQYWMYFMAKLAMCDASLEHWWLRDIAKVPEFQR